MVRGDTEAISVAVEDVDGIAVPLESGDKVYFTVKKGARTEAKELQKVVEDFIDGEALITIRPEDTRHMDFKVYYYDIQLTRADGDVRTIIPMSSFTIAEEITYE